MCSSIELLLSKVVFFEVSFCPHCSLIFRIILQTIDETRRYVILGTSCGPYEFRVRPFFFRIKKKVFDMKLSISTYDPMVMSQVY